MGTGQNAHDFATPGINPDVGTQGIHGINRIGLAKLPRSCLEFIRSRRQRANGAKIDDIALQFRGHCLVEIGGDFHILATARGAQFLNPAHFGSEADAAGALDAAGHLGLHQRADVFIFDGALVFHEAVVGFAIGHGLVLQIAFAALIANRAIQRVVDKQEFHDAFAGLLHLRGAGENFRRFAIGSGTQIIHRHGAGSLRFRRALHFNQAHAAVAGNRQAFVETETRHFGASLFAGLQQRGAVLDFDFNAVYFDLGHPVFASQAQRWACQRSLSITSAQPNA